MYFSMNASSSICPKEKYVICIIFDVTDISFTYNPASPSVIFNKFSLQLMSFDLGLINLFFNIYLIHIAF